MTVYDIFLNFYIYGFLGWCAEVAFAAVKEKRFVNRGFLNGPLCPIYGVGVSAVVALMLPYGDRLVVLFFLSAVLVTALEWLTGFLLEVLFHHKWWDYSGMPLNLNGYVCLPFSLMWGVACVFIVKVLHPLIDKGCSFLPEWLVLVLLSVCSVAFIVDLSVTVAGILNMNRKLEKLEEIAQELRKISDHVGENIYQNVMEGMEQQEIIKEKAEEYQESIRSRMEELRGKYGELVGNPSYTARRVLKAFPKMQSKKHQKIWEDLRQKYEELQNKLPFTRK